MIYTTERKTAEVKTNEIIAIVEKSEVDYCIRQTPYKVFIQLRKKFLNDYSSISVTNSASPSFSSIPSSERQTNFSLPHENNIDKNDQFEEMKKELVESKQIIVKLKDDIEVGKSSVDKLKS